MPCNPPEPLQASDFRVQSRKTLEQGPGTRRMSDHTEHELIDIRSPLASSRNARVEIGRDGILHLLAGPVTLHMDRATCEEVTTTLARAMVALAELQPKARPPGLTLVRSGEEQRHAIGTGEGTAG